MLGKNDISYYICMILNRHPFDLKYIVTELLITKTNNFKLWN